MATRATTLSLRNFRRSGELRRTTRRLSFWLGVCVAALVSAAIVAGFPPLAIAIPMILAGSAAAMRHPTPFVLGLFVLSGTFGSLAAFTGITSGPITDLLIMTVLLAAFLQLLWARRESRFLVWPGVLAWAVYIGLTFCEILTSPNPAAGVDSFRTMTLLMMLVLIFGYSGWDRLTLDRMAKGMLLVALAVGGYASLRWAIGPAASERAYAAVHSGGFVTVDAGRLLQLGSFGDQHDLGLWTATTAPFCCALGISMEGRWRLVAFAATALLVVGLLGSEVRSALVALVAGLAVVIVLFQLSRSHSGLNLGRTLLAGVLTAGTVTALYLATVGPGGTARYSRILHPSEDPAYQQRQGKWAEALRDIHKHPFGHGLGTAGATNAHFGRYANVANNEIDNTYLEVAWQQGLVVMILFGFALALLAADLARHTVRTLDPGRAAIGAGAVGTAVALAVMLYFGGFLDHPSIVGPWALIGLGAAQFSTVERMRNDERPEPATAKPRQPASVTS